MSLPIPSLPRPPAVPATPLHAAPAIASLAAALLAGAVLTLAPTASRAAPATVCSKVGLCYCTNADFSGAVAEKVAYYRKLIAEQRAKGKAIGYLSIPLSTGGGGFFNVNREVAEKARQRIEARFGAASVWILNPTASDADLPTLGGVRASQGDYMIMWTQVLEGPSGLGEDFDFVYFAGPSDFAAYFGLTGTGDMDRIAQWFDERLATDADLKRAVDQGRLTATSFRNYYGLRSSAAFSAGARDEWNAVRLVNERRRADPKLGVTQLLPVMFDGRQVSGAEFEQVVAGGNAGACKG